MSVQLGNSNNLYLGIREYSGQVTNTYAGFLQSAGAQYSLTLPFLPDKFEWWNFTAYATNDSNISGVWFRNMAAARSLIVRRGTTTLTSTLEAANGVTLINTASSFTDQHRTITGVSAGVVTTSTAHGLSDGSRVIITKLAGNLGDELNFRSYVADVQSSTTFALYDVYGNAITQVAAYTSGGQITREGPELGIVNSQPVYGLTLGTAVMGADNDVLYFVASQFNSYYNLGDVA